MEGHKAIQQHQASKKLPLRRERVAGYEGLENLWNQTVVTRLVSAYARERVVKHLPNSIARLKETADNVVHSCLNWSE